MKRIVSLITGLVLIFTMMTAPLGAAAADEEVGRYNEALDFLDVIGVMEGIDRTTIANPIIREDFAVYLANLMGVETQKMAEERYFDDLSMSSYGTYAINNLVDRGVLSLPEDRRFRPKDSITLAECLKMICVATGYGDYAKMNGGFPTGYLTTAKRNGIVPEILNSEAVSIEEAAEMLYRAGQLSLYETVGISSNGNSQYTAERGATLLSVNRSIYFAKGTVTSVCGNSIFEVIADYDDIYIDGEKLEAAEACKNVDFLGEYVKYFYKYDKKTETKTVIHMINAADEESITIPVDDFLGYTTGSTAKISYYGGSDGDKKIEKRIENPKRIVYNGYPIGTGVANMFNSLNKGFVSLKDTDRNGEYDTVIVNDYKNLVINYIDTERNVIYNKLNSSETVELEKFENVVIWDEDHNVLEPGELTASDVLAVAKSKDGAVVTIIRSNNVFNGKIDRKKTEGGRQIISIGGTDYPVEKSYAATFAGLTTLGGTYYYSLDFLGNICYVDEADGNGMAFAWVIASNIEEEAFSNMLQVKMLTEDGKIGIYDFAKNARVDGVVCKGTDAVYNALKNAKTTNKSADDDNDVSEFIIRYLLNDAGQIREVDTAYAGTESRNTTLSSVYSEDFEQHYHHSGRIGVKAYINSATLVFGMPAASSWGGEIRDSEYLVTTGGSYASDSNRSANIYTTNVKNAYANVVVYKYNVTGLAANNTQPKPFMVDRIERCLSADGEIVNKLCGYSNGVYTEYEVENGVDLTNAVQGSLVRLRFGNDGRVVPVEGADDVEVLYTAAKAALANPRPNADGVNGVDSDDARIKWNNIKADAFCYYSTKLDYDESFARLQLAFGYAHSKVGDMVRMSYTKNPGGAFDPNTFDEVINAKSTPIVVYDKSLPEDERVYKGTVSDILDSESAGDNCSIILFHTRIFLPQTIIVYK